MAVCCFGKRNVLRLDVKESREGFCRRGSGRSFHVEKPKTEKVREPTVGSLGTRNLEADRDYQKQSGEYRRLCEVEDTQAQREDGAVRVVYLQYSRECLPCTEFFVGLGASGQIQKEERYGYV